MPGRNDDNRANQMNPNNDAYYQSRGLDGRPDNWEQRPGVGGDWYDGDDDEYDDFLGPNLGMRPGN